MMPNRLIKRSYTEMLRLRVLDLEDQNWELRGFIEKMIDRLKILLDEMERSDSEYRRDPGTAYKFDAVKKAKIEFASYINQTPELKVLLRTYTAEPHESDNHSAEYAAKGVVNRIENKSKRLK